MLKVKTLYITFGDFGMSPINNHRLQDVIKRFRILKDWRIKWDNSGDMYGQTVVFMNSRQAWIYPWDPKSVIPEPSDFLLHEVMHCSLKALLAMDKRKQKEIRKAEEELIQDICGIMVDLSKSCV